MEAHIAEDMIVEMIEAHTQDRVLLGKTSRRMLRVCLRVWWMLHQKNAAYGNSALEPLRIFSRASTIEQILVRIDDKLSRLGRGQLGGEDAELDMMGYLVLLRVAREDVGSGQPTEKL